MISEKYGRTYHYPFSPGTTSDDRINHTYWEDIQRIKTLVHTEKLDGENNCLSQWGVFARSHAAPTTSPWTRQLRERWELIKNDLGDIEIFGENLYAIHSIEYQRLETHFYIFAVRCMDQWLSSTVPPLVRDRILPLPTSTTGIVNAASVLSVITSSSVSTARLNREGMLPSTEHIARDGIIGLSVSATLADWM